MEIALVTNDVNVALVTKTKKILIKSALCSRPAELLSILFRKKTSLFSQWRIQLLIRLRGLSSLNKLKDMMIWPRYTC